MLPQQQQMNLQQQQQMQLMQQQQNMGQQQQQNMGQLQQQNMGQQQQQQNMGQQQQQNMGQQQLSMRAAGGLMSQGQSVLQQRLQQRSANNLAVTGGGSSNGVLGLRPQSMMSSNTVMMNQRMASLNPRIPPPMYMGPNGATPIGSPLSHNTSSPGNPNQFIHSPTTHNMMSPGCHRALAPSPSMSASVLTPLSEGGGPSSVEEIQYLEKVRELGKYIEPLQRMISRIGNEDQDKLAKMKRLMDILSNPTKRMPIETLLKCETVLKRMIGDDNLKSDHGKLTESNSSSSSNINPILEAIYKLGKQSGNSNGLDVPLNHSLQRTFGGPLETIYGASIDPPSWPRKRSYSESREGISDILQGEIARLQSIFKVNIDSCTASLPSQGTCRQRLRLICQLDSKHLPSVPPLSIIIPSSYPDVSPILDLKASDYQLTEFLQRLHEALSRRLLYINSKHTLSQLLNTWEMSVRAACSPKQVPVTPLSVAMGL